ncbi:unnamed protein product [Urochloa humidicola]
MRSSGRLHFPSALASSSGSLPMSDASARTGYGSGRRRPLLTEAAGAAASSSGWLPASDAVAGIGYGLAMARLGAPFPLLPPSCSEPWPSPPSRAGAKTGIATGWLFKLMIFLLAKTLQISMVASGSKTGNDQRTCSS